MDATSDDDYHRLLRFRVALRQFLHWSEEQARSEGMTPAQHQLLLAIRGHDGGGRPTVGDVAGALLVRHHSAGELIDRAEQAGLVRRHPDPDDHRLVRLSLTPDGIERVDRLSRRHLAEIGRPDGLLASMFRAGESTAGR